MIRGVEGVGLLYGQGTVTPELQVHYSVGRSCGKSVFAIRGELDSGGVAA